MSCCEVEPLSEKWWKLARRQLEMAYWNAAAFSNDPRTQVGAVLVTKGGEKFEGANGTPADYGIDLTDPAAKYKYVEHAERSVIYLAARYGVKTAGSILYAPWFACPDCARAIVLAGVEMVVGHQDIFDRTPERWLEPIAVGNRILDEAGVKRVYAKGKIGGCEVLFNGEFWQP